MKKAVAFLMVRALLAALTGCGNGGIPAPGSSPSVPESSAESQMSIAGSA